MKRLIALAIAMFMLVLALASCGDKPASTTESTTAATTATTQGTTATTEATEPTATTENGNVVGDGYQKADGYLDVDFGGQTFKFITTDDMSDEVGRWQTEHEIAVESRDGGTIIDTAVYDRNAVMSKLYNCTIVAETGNAGDIIKDEVTSGGQEVAFGSQEYFQFNSNGGQNFVNLYDLNIDLEVAGWNLDWFNQVTVKDSAGNKKLFTFDGDFNLMGYKGIWVLAMNLDLYEQNFTEDFFDVVAKGNWTIDKMIELCSIVTNETGDQEMNVGDDTFGLLTTTHNVFGLIAGSNIHFIKNVDGVLETSVDIIKENNAIDAVNKMIELYALDGVKYDNGYTSNQTELQNGRTLFIGEVLDIVDRCKDVEDLNITVVPEPKYDAAQENYISYVQNKTSTYFVSKNACGGDLEMVSNFLNVFVYHSNKIVLPAFKTAYGSLYCQDSRSVEMLELIMKSRIYDYGYYGAGMYGIAGDSVTSGTNQLSTASTKWVNKMLKPLISNYVAALDKTNG